jgi:hypothetical protein
MSAAFTETSLCIGITAGMNSDIIGHIKGLIRTLKQLEFT